MKSRTFCCNGPLLKKDLFRGIPLWGAYLLCWLVALPLLILSEGRWRSSGGLQIYVLEMAAHAAHPVAFCYGLVTACLVFSWQFKSRSANFFGALPLRRETQFLTHYLAGLLYALIPHAVAALLTIPAGWYHGTGLALEALTWLASMTIAYGFYYSFAVLLAQIVGNLTALPPLYLVLNFTVIVVEAIVTALLQCFVYGIQSRGHLTLGWASPLYYALAEGPLQMETVWRGEEVYGGIFHGWGHLGVLAAVGAAFTVIAFLLHKFRRMESAGDVIAIRHLKPVFLYCFTVGCSLVLGIALSSILSSGLTTGNFVPAVLCMLAGAVIGYFLGEMMLHRSIRVFRKRNFLNCAVCCCVILAAMLCLRFDLTGYSAYVPERTEIKAVGIGTGSCWSEDPELIDRVQSLHQDCVDRQREVEQMMGRDVWMPEFILRYELTDGRIVYREYDMPVTEETAVDPDSLIRQLEEILNHPDYITLRLLPKDIRVKDIAYCSITDNFGGQVFLTPDETYSLLQTALLPDLRETTMGSEYYSDQYRKDLNQTFVDIWIEIGIVEGQTAPGQKVQDITRYYTANVTADAMRVAKFLSAYDLQPNYE